MIHHRCDLLFRAAIAEGTKLFPKRTCFHPIALYLRLDGSRIKKWLRGWVGSCAMVCALFLVSLLLRSDRLGVGGLLFWLRCE